MKKINILYYEPTSGFGGSSRCLMSWLKKIDREKYNPVVAAHFNGPAIQKIKSLGIKVIDIPLTQMNWKNNFFIVSHLILFSNFLMVYLPTAIILYILAKKYGIRLFHLNAKVISSIPGIIASKLTGIPCICHLHDVKEPVKRERFFAKGVDCFIALTEKAKQLYERVYPGKQIELIPNGVDLKEYESEVDVKKARKEFNIEENEKIVGIVGRLVEGKGFDDFIKAAAIIISKTKKVKFMIVGSASDQNKEYENELKNLAESLDMMQKIIFAGWREDMKQIMSMFDVLVQASSTFREGFPLVCLEAMALTKPVVVTDIPGPSEIVIDGDTGYIVPPANPEKLAEAIIKIILNENLARTMGENGRERAEEYFNLDIIIKKIESVYQSLLLQG